MNDKAWFFREMMQAFFYEHERIMMSDEEEDNIIDIASERVISRAMTHFKVVIMGLDRALSPLAEYNESLAEADIYSINEFVGNKVTPKMLADVYVEMQKLSGKDVHYTPEAIADWTAYDTVRNYWLRGNIGALKEIRVFDPHVGTGNLLMAMLKHIKEGLGEDRKRLIHIANRMYGFGTDYLATSITRFRLYCFKVAHGGDVSPNKNIRQRDIYHKPISEKEAKRMAINVIVSQPPSEIVNKPYVMQSYAEDMSDVLVDDGVLSVLLDSDDMHNSSNPVYHDMKPFLLENGHVIKIQAFSEDCVGDGLHHVIWEKGKESTVTYMACSSSDNSYMEQLTEDKDWRVITNMRDRFKHRMDARGRKIKDFGVEIHQGINHTNGFVIPYVIPKWMKDVLVDKDIRLLDIIRPFNNNKEDEYVILVHGGYQGYGVDSEVPPLDVEKYPVLKAYFNMYEITDYSLPKIERLGIFDVPRLVVYQDKKQIEFAESNEIAGEGQHVIVGDVDTLEYIRRVMNSEVMQWVWDEYYNGQNIGEIRIPYEVNLDCVDDVNKWLLEEWGIDSELETWVREHLYEYGLWDDISLVD